MENIENNSAIREFNPPPYIFYHVLEARFSDRGRIAKLHKDVRVATDMAHHPDYTQAAVREGYFDKVWAGYWKPWDRKLYDRVLKVTTGIYDEVIAFTRFGIIEPPQDLINKDEKRRAGLWGELHQIYIQPEYQHRGLGKKLWGEAADQLLSWGCKHMLINVLEANANARGFYEYQGAKHIASIIEENTRDGCVFKVPCTLYVVDLTPRG